MSSAEPNAAAPNSPAVDGRIGTTLPGGWTVEAPIGSGGMAMVFRVRGDDGRLAAAKILRQQFSEDAEICKRFALEIRAANRLGHAGALDVFDAGVSDDGAPFMVMELLEGVTLSRRLSIGPPIETDELLAIADAVLDVLAAAHEKNIIHRDVKPANVFLTSKGDVKLLDFGIAKLMSVEQSLQTAPGSTLGTLGYMAPEQVKGRADARSDVFSVGATMFRILTGRPVHPGRNLVQALQRVATEAAPAVSTLAPHVSRDLAAVVDTALAFQREERYPDARTMQEDLAALRRGERPAFALSRATHGAEDPTRQLGLNAVPVRGAERLIGARLKGGYVLGRLLGRGGMGAVYESTTPSGEPCAVKVILSHGDVDARSSEERFRREAGLAAKIVHPNVVRTLEADVDVTAGHPYFVMERLEGHDLATWVRDNGPLEGAVVAKVFVQACRGVRAAHALGIIHRDLKPANIMLSEQGEELVPKICDFGLAKNTLGEAGEHGHSLTRSGGALLGTPHYTAPEQAMQAKNADQRSDVWGLCISMYEALSGSRPWIHCETLAQLLLAICTEPIPPLTSVAPWVDPALAAVVHRGLEREPERRFPSVEALEQALLALTNGEVSLAPDMLVDVPISSKDLTRVMRGADAARGALAATPGVTPRAVSHASGASLDALASSGTVSPVRPRRRLVAAALLVALGAIAGWLTLRVAPSTQANGAPRREASTSTAASRAEVTPSAVSSESTPSHSPSNRIEASASASGASDSPPPADSASATAAARAPVPPQRPLVSPSAPRSLASNAPEPPPPVATAAAAPSSSPTSVKFQTTW